MIERPFKSARELATEIVVAYLAGRSLEPKEVVEFLGELCEVLVNDERNRAELDGAPRGAPASVEASTASPPKAVGPAVPPEASIFPGYLISLEDGKPYRSLKRHLMAKYGMTPEDYRRKWGLSPDYPMVAPEYSRERSDVAKRSGLGKRNSPVVRRVRR